MVKKLKGSERFEKLVKKAQKIDWEKHWKEQARREEEEAKRKAEEARKEKERINNMACPLCKSTEKSNVTKRESNGIMGPGGSSWETENYYVCMNCGVMYKDIEKLKRNG